MTEWIICPEAEAPGEQALIQIEKRMEAVKMSMMEISLRWIDFDIQIRIGRDEEKQRDRRRRRVLQQERIRSLENTDDLRNDYYYQSMIR